MIHYVPPKFWLLPTNEEEAVIRFLVRWYLPNPHEQMDAYSTWKTIWLGLSYDTMIIYTSRWRRTRLCYRIVGITVSWPWKNPEEENITAPLIHPWPTPHIGDHSAICLPNTHCYLFDDILNLYLCNVHHDRLLLKVTKNDNTPPPWGCQNIG